MDCGAFKLGTGASICIIIRPDAVVLSMSSVSERRPLPAFSTLSRTRVVDRIYEVQGSATHAANSGPYAILPPLATKMAEIKFRFRFYGDLKIRVYGPLSTKVRIRIDAY